MADTHVRRKHGGLTKTGGGTGGSFAYLLLGEGRIASLNHPDAGRAILTVWATDNVEPEHQRARQALLEELTSTLRPDEDFWEAANDIATRRTVTIQSWSVDSSLLPRARATAELAMIAQSKIRANGGYIMDAAPRRNWVDTYLMEDTDTAMAKAAEVFPDAMEQFGDQMREMHPQQPIGWFSDQMHKVAAAQYQFEVQNRQFEPVPAAPILDHFDSLIESGITKLEKHEYMQMREELSSPIGYVILGVMHRNRSIVKQMWQGVDTHDINFDDPKVKKWCDERYQMVRKMNTNQEHKESARAQLDEPRHKTSGQIAALIASAEHAANVVEQYEAKLERQLATLPRQK